MINSNNLFIGIRSSFALLPNRSLRIFKRNILIQCILSLLDLVGVALVAALAALSVRGIQSKSAGDRVEILLSTLGIESLSFQNQVVIIGLAAVVIMLIKTVLSVMFTRKNLNFLAKQAVDVSSELLAKFYASGFLNVSRFSKQEVVYLLSSGVELITLGVIATAGSVLVDFSLLIILATVLIYVDPLTALFSGMVFFLVSVFSYRVLQKRATSIGNKITQIAIKNNELVNESVTNYRELSVIGGFPHVHAQIKANRLKLAPLIAESNFYPYLTKYVLEAIVLVSGLLLAGYEFYANDASRAIALLSVFLAAGTRLTPAVLRIQQGLLQIKTCLGLAEKTLVLSKELVNTDFDLLAVRPYNKFLAFPGNLQIRMSELNFKYPSSNQSALRNVTINLKENDLVAIVGSSGSGKSTLADLILGILEPTSGEISISGLTPRELLERHPGTAAYVPQEINLLSGSLRENIEIGFPPKTFSDNELIETLSKVNLIDLLRELPLGLDTIVGEGARKLSGGQKQRIGIARSLLTNPRILILDEATSAVDGITEQLISTEIQKLTPGRIIIAIAHRLSTVQAASQVLFMNSGELVASGTFAQVRNQVPDFDKLARLSGL